MTEQKTMRANGTSANGVQQGWKVQEDSKLLQHITWQVSNDIEQLYYDAPFAMTLNYFQLYIRWCTKLVTDARSAMKIKQSFYTALHNLPSSIAGQKILHVENRRLYWTMSCPARTYQLIEDCSVCRSGIRSSSRSYDLWRPPCVLTMALRCAKLPKYEGWLDCLNDYKLSSRQSIKRPFNSCATAVTENRWTLRLWSGFTLVYLKMLLSDVKRSLHCLRSK